MYFKNFFYFLSFSLISFSAISKEQTYYEVLEISRTAAQDEIKKAYRRQAQKWHPDKYPSEEEKERVTEKFRKIQTAYETLIDPQKRQRYDQFGHQNWTSSQEQTQSQKGDFYSEAFKDIFNKSDRMSSRPMSQKSLYLFKKLTLLKNSKAKTEIHFSLLDSLLKQLLEEFKISDFNHTKRRQTRERILQDIASYTQEVKNIIALNETEEKKEESLKWSLRRFITEVENKYMVEEITFKERQAVELFYQFSFFRKRVNDFLGDQKRKLELLNKEQEKTITSAEQKELEYFQKEERKDLRVFRKILSALGLPSQTHHDLLLRSYLDALKHSLFSAKFGEKLLTHDSRPAHQFFYMEDREIIKTLRGVKTSFDSIHYENLRSMANPFKLNFLKNFPGQFIVFQTAIGASLYRQALSDPHFYGAERNPGLLMETMKHSLTPAGVASFFIFVAVAQQMNYRLYGLGRWMDGKSLKGPFGKISLNGKWGRAIAPGAGLGFGFFVSAVFDELIRDPHLGQCVKTMYKKTPEESLIRDQADSCENFYNNWSRSEKWTHYGVDILTLIGSGVLSHKFINTVLYGLRLTSTGSHLLIAMTKTVGLRVAGWAGFFIHMYFFMEFHKVLDKYVGHPLKEQLSAGGAKSRLVELTEQLNQDLYALPSFDRLIQGDSLELRDLFSEQLNRIEGGIKALGARFKGWADTSSMFYTQSVRLWGQETNQLLLPYEASSQLLKDLFIFSRASYNLTSDEFHIKEDQTWDSDKQVNEETIESWNSLNTLASFDSAKIKPEHYKQKYCPQVDESLLIWDYFCHTAESFFEVRDLIELYNADFFVETAELIYNYLQTIPVTKSYELNPIDYVGMGHNELFSSDPRYSIKKFNYAILDHSNLETAVGLNTADKMSYDKKFELAKLLIKTGLNKEDSWSYLNSDQILELKSEHCSKFFSDYETNPDSKELYDYCYNSSAYQTEIGLTCESWFPEDQTGYEDCVEFFASSTGLKTDWSFKMLSAGIYLLKDIISDLKQRRLIHHSQYYAYQINNIEIFLPILDLVEPMEVYKKGEQKFVQSKETFIQYKNQLNREEKNFLETQFELSNPYALIKSMICGSEKEEGFLFSSKKFFNRDSLIMYHFSQYRSIDKICENLPGRMNSLHSFLFDMPVQLEGKNYENLYLALEEQLKGYSSTQELQADFKSLSQDQLDRLSHKISHDLELVTENYYRDIIELKSPVHAQSSLADFSKYYNRHRILWDIRSFTGGLKGLEISIFQVSYWLEILKKLLLAGEKNRLNSAFDRELGDNPKKFRFNQKEFEIMQTEILSLLQSYNDSFQKDQGPYFTFPDKEFLEEIQNNHWQIEESEGKMSLLNRLWQAYPHSENPLMVSPDIILSHVLAHSIPAQNNYHKIKDLIERKLVINVEIAKARAKDTTAFALVRPEKIFQAEWEVLIDSVIIELNASLVNFFTQLEPLRFKESFENQALVFQRDELLKFLNRLKNGLKTFK